MDRQLHNLSNNAHILRGETPHVEAMHKSSADSTTGSKRVTRELRLRGDTRSRGYGAWCTKYFVRTPQFTLPPWDVITFNYGLHDGADTNASYLSGISSIADQLIDTAKSANPSKPSRLIYDGRNNSLALLTVRNLCDTIERRL